MVPAMVFPPTIPFRINGFIALPAAAIRSADLIALPAAIRGADFITLPAAIRGAMRV